MTRIPYKKDACAPAFVRLAAAALAGTLCVALATPVLAQQQPAQ